MQTEPGSSLNLRIRRGGQDSDVFLTIGSRLDLSSSEVSPIACQAQELNKQGIGLAGEGRLSDALLKFQEAIRIAPAPTAKLYYNDALILEQVGRFKEALDYYISAQKLFLLPDEEMETLSRMLVLVNRHEILPPEVADEHYRMGIVRAKQKRYSESVQEFEAALAIAPWIVDAYYNLGLVYEFIEDYSNSLRVLSIYVRLAPTAQNTGSAKTKIIELKDRLETIKTSPK